MPWPVGQLCQCHGEGESASHQRDAVARSRGGPQANWLSAPGLGIGLATEASQLLGIQVMFFSCFFESLGTALVSSDMAGTSPINGDMVVSWQRSKEVLAAQLGTDLAVGRRDASHSSHSRGMVLADYQRGYLWRNHWLTISASNLKVCDLQFQHFRSFSMSTTRPGAVICQSS